MESLNHHLQKSITYSDLFARERLEGGKKVGGPWICGSVPGCGFLRGYLLRRGFLDGWQGYAVARLAAQESLPALCKSPRGTVNGVRPRLNPTRMTRLFGKISIGNVRRHKKCFAKNCSGDDNKTEMPKASLADIVAHCDKILRTAEVGDYDGAANGLQVENSGAVTKIAAAVDASLATVKLAIAAKADLLIVHHGLFWSPRQPWTGKNHELLQLLVENNLAIYSSHLPLDAHPRLGNNARLCAALGLKNLKPFFQSHGQTIGFKSQTKISRTELAAKLERATGVKPKIIPGGKIFVKTSASSPVARARN